ncbi:MAG: hypothetical protein ACRDJE_16520 [Dehalococcoidia bacterium]
MARVRRGPSTELERLTVRLKDGRVLTGTASGCVRLERREDIEAKFRDDALRTIVAEDAQWLLGTVHSPPASMYRSA